jgi:transposase
MMKNRKLAKAFADAALYEFRRQIEYKAKMNGFQVHVVSKWFPSSKTCSECGHVKEDLSLSEREYVCENSNCRHVIDRDLNAAINLRDKYIETVSRAIEWLDDNSKDDDVVSYYKNASKFNGKEASASISTIANKAKISIDVIENELNKRKAS